jgi:hypothetical protein
MDASAPAFLQQLEASGLGAAIREATWVYPAANVLHVLSVVVFAGAVAVMDARLLGAFAQAPPADVLRGARRFAVGAFMAIALTGFVLFTAEASHVALNPVFQTKLLLIALALVNVIVFELIFRRRLAQFPPHMPLPAAARISAFLSLATWLAVVACGRSIAYV